MKSVTTTTSEPKTLLRKTGPYFLTLQQAMGCQQTVHCDMALAQNLCAFLGKLAIIEKQHAARLHS